MQIIRSQSSIETTLKKKRVHKNIVIQIITAPDLHCKMSKKLKSGKGIDQNKHHTRDLC